MATISLCMIVKNEEKVLGRCLDSAAGLVDEMVIVDTGSTDATREVASAYTSRIYDFPWRDDFAAARNFAFSKGNMDYLMWLDADDVLLPEDREAFLEPKRTLSSDVDVVMSPITAVWTKAGGRSSPATGSGWCATWAGTCGRVRSTRPSPPSARWSGPRRR